MRIYKTLMNKAFICLLITVLAACKSTPYSDETTKSDLRAPAYPLLTLHPHMKLWSMTDELNKQNMTFGGSTQLPFVGFLRVDGAMYRLVKNCRCKPSLRWRLITKSGKESSLH